MKKQWSLIVLLGLLNWMNGCDMFNQNDFIESGKIGDVDDKELVYNLYQTGIDNYRYEINLIDSQDTTDLFTAYLNDANANDSRFSLDEEESSETTIRVNKPVGGQEKKVNGRTFRLQGIK